MSIFVKYGCGCIGFNVSRPAKRSDGLAAPEHLILSPCDSTGDDCGHLSLSWRILNRENRVPTPLTEGEEQAILDQLGGQLSDGARFFRLSTLLQDAVNPHQEKSK